MKKIITTILFTIGLLVMPANIYAQNVAGHSAQIIPEIVTATEQKIVKKKLVLQRMLKKHNSPLSDSADSFITTCQTFKLECYLLPSISGLESNFGKFVLPNSFNPFGWAGGYMIFESWDKAIAEVGKGLKENYVAKGADTVEEIAPIYAESKTWAPRVQYFMNEFKKEEENLDSILDQNAVNL